MSLIYKRPDSPIWYVTKTRKSTKTTNRRLAEEFARKATERAWREKSLGTRIYTYSELAAEYLDMKSDIKTVDRYVFITKDLGDFLGKRKLLDCGLGDIGEADLRQYVAQVKQRASARTANMHIHVINAMFKRAQKHLQEPIHLERYSAPQMTIKPPTEAEIEAIRSHLPEWAADMAEVAFQTGMRYSNVAGLRWEWINPDMTLCLVPPTKAKTERLYTVPINEAAREVLAKRRALDLGSDIVFWKPEAFGEVIGNVRVVWERACEKAGVKARWHDLRHAWCSGHLANGTPDRVVQEMAGWSSPAMLQRYGHLKTEHLTKWANNVSAGTAYVSKVEKP